MKAIQHILAGSVAVMILTSGAAFAEETPQNKQPQGHDMSQMKMPQPTEQHQWLQKMVGEWHSKTTMKHPGQEPEVSEGSETVEPLGQFWTVNHVEATMQGQPFKGQMTCSTH